MADLLSVATRHLLETHAIPAVDVVRLGVRAHDVSQSNGVALVELGNGRSFAVKRPSFDSDPGQGSPAAERCLYEAATSVPACLEFMPGLHQELCTPELLVLAGLATSRRVDRLADPSGALPDDLVAALGTTLARWHAASAQLNGIEGVRPWMLDIDGPNRIAALDANHLLRAVALKIADDPVLRGVAARLRDGWRSDVVIHGDMRLANVLVCRSPPAIRFIDWETSGWGDPRWDLAGLVQELITAALMQGHDQLAPPFDEAVRTLVAAYRAAATDDALTDGLGPFVAGRMMMRAFQLANWATDDSGDAVEAHLRAAAAIDLDDPFSP